MSTINSIFVLNLIKMKEIMVLCDTAVLAKEKGFPQIILGGDYIYRTTKEPRWWEMWKFSEYEKMKVSAPTQSLLQKWLREKHNIHFIIECLQNNGGWRITMLHTKRNEFVHIDDRFEDYETALDEGLLIALKSI